MLRRFLFLFLSAFFAAFPAAVNASPCWENLTIEPLKILFWNDAQKLCGYQNMENLWTVNTVSKGVTAPSPMPRKPGMVLPSPGAFMRNNNVHGMLVVHNGAILLENYQQGFGSDKRWTSFSMAKSLTALLVGAAVADGSIRSLDDPVSAYIPELAQGAYAGATIRHVLTMTSGVAWNENYRDPKADVNKLTDAANSGEAAFLKYMASRKRVAKPGSVFTYSTGEAGVVGCLVRRGTGKSLAEYMSEKIWSTLGMEQDAIWITDRTGKEISGCCFSATVRDYARVGLFMLRNGRANERDVLPQWWIKEATTASAPSRKQRRPYGYQIWIREGSAYQASGIFGQLIHVDPARNLVLVMASAWENATGTPELRAERNAYIASIKKAVDAASPAKKVR